MLVTSIAYRLSSDNPFPITYLPYLVPNCVSLEMAILAEDQVFASSCQYYLPDDWSTDNWQENIQEVRE